jgi:hypothetical protein
MRERKPKTTTCFQCKTEHPDQHYERVVYNKHELHGPWAGWRMAGKDLVSPDGDRINPHRLAGFLWTERVKSRLRRKT